MKNNINACPACHVPYIHHLGLIGTCAALMESLLHGKEAEKLIDEQARRIRTLEKLNGVQAKLINKMIDRENKSTRKKKS
jgi:uncharacterized membrane-anchored protein YjiN (DUF445 family)